MQSDTEKGQRTGKVKVQDPNQSNTSGSGMTVMFEGERSEAGKTHT